MNKEAILEGLLFVVGDEGITLDNIAEVLEVDKKEAQKLLKDLQDEYNQKLITTRGTNTLSSAALETLAIIAYNQPITRAEIDELRGIASINMIRKLMAKDLVKISGKSNLPGKPNLYRTTNEFLDYFGLATISDLPDLPINESKEENEEELFTSIYKEEK